MQAGEGGGASNTSGDMFNMRGFSANNSLFVDGVRDDGLIARDVFNLEQIEVFSGPTGTDVGRTNAAGYINLSTKTPQSRGARGRNAQLRGRRSGRARRSISISRCRSASPARSWVTRRSRECALAGWRCRRAATTPTARAVDRAVDRVRARLSTRSAVGGQFMRQDNLADYGLPRPRHRRPLTRRLSRRVSGGSDELLRKPGLRLRPGQPGQRDSSGSSTTSARLSPFATRPATTRRRARRSSPASPMPRHTTRTRIWSPSAARRTSATTTSSRTRRT